MHDEQMINQESNNEDKWDLLPKVEHEAEVTVLEVNKDKVDNAQVYVLLLQDKRNVKLPVVLDITVTEEGRFIGCYQEELDHVVDDYEEVRKIYRPANAT